MLNRQLHLSSTSDILASKSACLSALALLILSMSFSAAAAGAASDSAGANARYQEERARCISGQSNQDRATCLKEAGAALQEARRGRLHDDQAADQANALLRCNALPVDDRDACQRRMNGEGTTSGSALEGGISRELSVPDKK
ncbi:hypothetical protein BCF11_5409 [Collimonas sp. PA-H2]|uniref:hypothetical protein n=1 Tax=Collimonas sp. PA-H2 TaxID=1881062 RepID=UPI000C00AF98|nr:hypothetical protein [Collimonas sp. PA-H2]PFH04625.1 hypothetical protein BCF11_5409 [Collimonas sp. PA-H2]